MIKNKIFYFYNKCQGEVQTKNLEVVVHTGAKKPIDMVASRNQARRGVAVVAVAGRVAVVALAVE